MHRGFAGDQGLRCLLASTRRCSGLVLSGGFVDEDATRRASDGVVVEAGTMVPPSLRRLGLLLAMRERLDQDVVLSPLSFRVPPALLAQPSVGVPLVIHSTWGSSSQTSLHYRLVESGGLLLEDEVTWPNSSTAVEQVADDLIIAAEKTFVAGCAPLPLPAGLDLRGEPGGVSHLDASRQSLRQVGDELSEALEALRARPVARCR